MVSASKSTTLTANTGSPYTNATLTASFNENSTSTSGNTSNITVTATQKIGNADWSSSYTSSLKIYWYDNNANSGGKLVATTNVTSQGRNATITATGTINVGHKTDGSLSGYAKAVWTKGGNSNYTPNSGEVSTTNTALTKIPRYATANQILNNKTETTIVMNWSSDSTIDYIWYSINNGSSWTGVDVSDGKSGSYTISGLTANTAYKIKTRVRRKDSQLTTDSSALSVTTYAYPYANSMPNFTIGDKLTIGLYNPLGRSVQVYFIGSDNVERLGGTVSGTSISPWNNSSWQTAFYSTIPNAKSGTYKVKVVYGSVSTTKTGGTYSINTSACTPTIGTVSYQDTNSTTTGVTRNNQLIVQKKSTVRYTASSLSVKNSATISSCKVTVNGNNYNMSVSGTTATGGNAAIDSSSNVTATVTLTDSRGLTATKNITVQMLAWFIPTAIITLQRHSNFYSDTDINVNADYASVNGKNTITIQMRYKKATASSWGSYIAMQDDMTITRTLDNNYEWNIQVVLTDKFGTATYNAVLSRGLPIIYFDKNKSSTGFNCFPQDEQSVEINGVNMLKAIQGEELFKNDNGASGTVTLSSSAANYAYIEIFYCDNNKNGYSSVKIYNSSGKTTDLSTVEASSTTNTLIRRTRYTISGTSITPNTTTAGYVQISSSTISTLGVGTNYIRIVKVVGHII